MPEIINSLSLQIGASSEVAPVKNHSSMSPVCHDHKGKLYDLPNTFIFLKIFLLFICMYVHVDVNEKKELIWS